MEQDPRHGQPRVISCPNCGHELDLSPPAGPAMTSPGTVHESLEAAIEDARGRSPNAELEPAVVSDAKKLEEDHLNANAVLVRMALHRLVEQGQLQGADRGR